MVHSGHVTGYTSLLASTGSFSVAIMSNDSLGEDLNTELFRAFTALLRTGLNGSGVS